MIMKIQRMIEKEKFSIKLKFKLKISKISLMQKLKVKDLAWKMLLIFLKVINILKKIKKINIQKKIEY